MHYLDELTRPFLKPEKRKKKRKVTVMISRQRVGPCHPFKNNFPLTQLAQASFPWYSNTTEKTSLLAGNFPFRSPLRTPTTWNSNFLETITNLCYFLSLDFHESNNTNFFVLLLVSFYPLELNNNFYQQNIWILLVN